VKSPDFDPVPEFAGLGRFRGVLPLCPPLLKYVHPAYEYEAGSQHSWVCGLGWATGSGGSFGRTCDDRSHVPSAFSHLPLTLQRPPTVRRLRISDTMRLEASTELDPAGEDNLNTLVPSTFRGSKSKQMIDRERREDAIRHHLFRIHCLEVLLLSFLFLPPCRPTIEL